jgi:hypothetical protein
MSTEMICSLAISTYIPTVFQGLAQAERQFWELLGFYFSNDNTHKLCFNAGQCFSAGARKRTDDVGIAGR